MADRFTLADVASAIWGPEWMGEMARTLGIAHRKVRRMNKGDAYVPSGVWRELADMLDKESERLDDLAGLARLAASIDKEKGRE